MGSPPTDIGSSARSGLGSLESTNGPMLRNDAVVVVGALGLSAESSSFTLVVASVVTSFERHFLQTIRSTDTSSLAIVLPCTTSVADVKP